MTPKQIIPLVGFALLSACGGGGGGTGGGGGGGGGASYTLLFDTTATGISGITVLSEDGSVANDLDHDTGDIVLGGLDGTYDPATKTVTFDGGGTAVLLDTGTEYVAIFEADPVGEDPFSGTLGMLTEVTDMPSGSSDFSGDGTARVVIIDNSTSADIFDLTGDVDVAVDFDGGLVDILFSDLDGTSVVLGAVSDVATFGVRDAALVDGLITGGDAEFDSDSLIETTLSASEDVATAAGLFGPSAAEVAGVVEIDDQDDGKLYLFGVFTAD